MTKAVFITVPYLRPSRIRPTTHPLPGCRGLRPLKKIPGARDLSLKGRGELRACDFPLSPCGRGRNAGRMPDIARVGDREGARSAGVRGGCVTKLRPLFLDSLFLSQQHHAVAERQRHPQVALELAHGVEEALDPLPLVRLRTPVARLAVEEHVVDDDEAAGRPQGLGPPELIARAA